MSAASRNDNTLARARAVNLSSNSKKFSDRIGGNDPKDFYRIQLNNRSQLKISINSFQSNATAALLDREGQVLQRSNRSGRKIKPIQQTLDPGTYHIRIASRRRDQSSQYRLTLKANPTALPTPIAPPSLPLPSPTLPEAVPTVDKARFNIRFDYRFDTIGWFTPDKRAALEAAARVWESIILDEFAEIPVGTRTLRVFNPETGRFISDGFTTDQVIDDVVIFVGSRELGGSFFSSTLAEAAPAGSLEPRITGADFEPWIGSISFDRSTNWFVDTTPNTSNDIPSNRTDLISTTVHEVGHILGFGTSNVYKSLIVRDGRYYGSTGFAGANAQTINGGKPIPVSNSGHFSDGYEFTGSGEPLMSAFAIRGKRKLPTVLDISVLDDIGYTVNYAAASSNPSASTASNSGISGNQRASLNQNQRTLLQGDGLSVCGSCGCAGCLMS